MRELTSKNQQMLDVLRNAVAEALDRKRRLGQYAIIWRDGRAVRIEPEDDPSELLKEHRSRRA